MEQKFYIAIDGQPAGPFTIEELKSKKIQRETLVWTDGLDNWTKAENIPILKDILRGIPPPLPNTEANTTSPKIPSIQTLPPPISNNKYFGYELALRRERLFAAIIEDIFEAVIISVLILLSGRDVFNDDLYSLYSFDSIVSNMILSAIFGAIFYSMWGGNLGHKIVGLAVISAQNGEIQNKAITGAVREALKSVFSLAFIPVLWLLWDDDKQNLYDKVVKTYVVKKKVGATSNFFRGCLLFILTFFFIIFLIIFGSIYFYIDGIHAVSNYIVKQIPTSVDKEVGRELRQEILRSVPIDEEKTELLSAFYLELGYDSKTKIYVVKGENFNAFALPDNSIFVFDRVLKEVKSYPELAALLGHEYTHIKKRHGMKTLVNSLSRELLTEILTGGEKSEKIISNSNRLLTLKNSRDFEIESDKGGLELLVQNRIDINGMVELLKRIEKLSEKSGKHIPTYLSTHPHIEDRLDAIAEEVKRKQNNYVRNKKLEQLFQQLKTFQH